MKRNNLTLAATAAGAMTRTFAWVAAAVLCGAAHAAATDISSVPLATAADAQAKPNIMFVLDNSGSMASDFMPDDVQTEFGNDYQNRYAYWSPQCNGVQYNPAQTYELPVRADGTAYPNAQFSAAWSDGYHPSFSASKSSTTSVAMVASGTVTLTLSSSSLTFYSGDRVAIVYQSDTSKWMTGTVSSWNSTTKSLSVNVTGASATGTYASWTVGTLNTTDLANRYYYKYIGSETAMGWRYNTTDPIHNTFYTECATTKDNLTSKFTKVTMTSASADAQNYANWYQYYRTRRLMARTTSGKAFQGMDSSYRVGFTVISDTTVATSSTFQDVGDFDDAQKATFFSNLYNATGNNSTPLRGALHKIGRYYAKKAPSQTYDPIQYSCQRNYTLLTTDGYWNTGSETATYGPFQLDGTTSVGEQDGGEVKPMWDGQTVTVKDVETWNSTATTVTTVVTPKTTVSTSAVTTTTTTPSKGWTQTVYSMTSQSGSSKTNSSISRCSSSSFSSLGYCTITVTTSSNHGFSTGNQVVVTGVATAGYNGTYTITKISNTQYSYNLSSRPSSTSGALGSSYYSPAGCAAGQGLVTQQAQRRDESTVGTSTVTTTTTTPSTTTAVTTTVAVTPYTHTTITTNGTLTSDTTTSGTVSSSSSTTSNTVTGTTSTSSATTTGTGANVFSTWTNYGSATTGSTCTASLPSPNPSTATQLGGPSSTTPSVSTGSPVTTGPTTTNGTASTTVAGPTTVVGTKTTTTTTTKAGGSSDSLADVAEYYYVTHLRSSGLSNCTGSLGRDVCTEDVPPAGIDTATWQHMTTFTVGFGVNGTLLYDRNYLTQTSGDYVNLKNGSVVWPVPSDGAAAPNIDDLWHAAVNGRGRYFSATNAAEVADAISSVLSDITAVTGASSAAATTALDPVTGDGEVYVALYTTVDWNGDLRAYTLDGDTGAISTNVNWSAQTELDKQAKRSAAGTDSRTIYYLKPSGSTPTLRSFTYANLTADGLNSNFDNFCTKSKVPDQCSSLSPANKTLANNGSNLVDWLRGTITYEVSANTASPLYRDRKHVLGDLINASPTYVGKPYFSYTDVGYTNFSTANASRTKMVYAAANDGMLHAFRAEGTNAGTEVWAYVPSTVMSNLYRLADTNYANNHQYFVDGSPKVGDVYDGTNWRTIIVGGLAGGGKTFYALDITNPSSPVALWEFTDTNLGYAYGNPIITKLSSGKWVVLLTSGYNNTSGSADGNGHLFVLDAITGQKLKDISTYTAGTTKAGSTTTPSGLARINTWIDSPTNNTARRVYGGDMLGNLWRFDIDDQVKPYQSAMQLAKFQIDASTPQPITTRPELLEVTYSGVKYPVVAVATGRYLGTTDIEDATQQSVYGVKDELGTTGWGDFRARSDVVAQTLSKSTLASGETVIKSTNNLVDWSKKAGWKMDFAQARERVFVNMLVYYNELLIASAIPGTSECSPSGGSSWLYTLNPSTGGPMSTAGGVVGKYQGNSLIMGMTLVRGVIKTGGSSSSGGSGNKKTKSVIVKVHSDGTVSDEVLDEPPTNTGNIHRSAWRELAD